MTRLYSETWYSSVFYKCCILGVPESLQRCILSARVVCLDKVPKLFYSLTSLDLLMVTCFC